MELIELNVLVYLTFDLLEKSGIFFLPGPRGRSGWKVEFSSRLWGLVAGEEQASFTSCCALAELIQGLKRYKNRVLSDPRLAYDWLKTLMLSMVVCPDHLLTHELCSMLLQVLELQATCKSEPVLGLPTLKCSDIHWAWELWSIIK